MPYFSALLEGEDRTVFTVGAECNDEMDFEVYLAEQYPEAKVLERHTPTSRLEREQEAYRRADPDYEEPENYD